MPLHFQSRREAAVKEMLTLRCSQGSSLVVPIENLMKRHSQGCVHSCLDCDTIQCKPSQQKYARNLQDPFRYSNSKPCLQGSVIEVGRRLIDGDRCEDSSACFGYIAAASPHDHLDFLANLHFASGPRAVDAVSWRRWSELLQKGTPLLTLQPLTRNRPRLLKREGRPSLFLAGGPWRS